MINNVNNKVFNFLGNDLLLEPCHIPKNRPIYHQYSIYIILKLSLQTYHIHTQYVEKPCNELFGHSRFNHISPNFPYLDRFSPFLALTLWRPIRTLRVTNPSRQFQPLLYQTYPSISIKKIKAL